MRMLKYVSVQFLSYALTDPDRTNELLCPRSLRLEFGHLLARCTCSGLHGSFLWTG